MQINWDLMLPDKIRDDFRNGRITSKAKAGCDTRLQCQCDPLWRIFTAIQGPFLAWANRYQTETETGNLGLHSLSMCVFKFSECPRDP